MRTFQNCSGVKVSKFCMYSIIHLPVVPSVVYIVAVTWRYDLLGKHCIGYMLAGQPSVCLNERICSSTLLVMLSINRVVCTISLWTFIVHNLDHFCQILFICRLRERLFTVFLTQIISRIIIKSEFKMIFFLLLNTQVLVAIVTGNPHTAVLKIG